MRQNLAAFQWVIHAVNTPQSSPLTLAGYGLQKQAGVTEARIDYPLQTLASLPMTRVSYSEKNLNLPNDASNGILVLQRQFLTHPAFVKQIEDLIRKGWLVIQDMDDDPHHWREFVESDFYAYRSVHAVTVSTEPLAAMMRAWNPEVQVFANAIWQLPQVTAAAPKQQGVIRLFFGALNRAADWRDLMPAFVQAIRQSALRIHCVVVHDRAFYEALPADISKECHPTLSHPHYLDMLGTCDLALLPLNDTRFNRMKSDLKFIECCAAGVVPVCSRIVYGEQAEHLDIGFFADTPEEWEHALIQATADVPQLAARRERGLHYVQTTRMHARQLPERLAYYQNLLARRESLEAARQQRLASIPPQFNPLA